MKQQLTTRFDKPKIETRARSIAHGTDLTMSDINRAALNIGLEILEVQKITYSKSVFEEYILDNQEAK